jgi:PAS domain S-box-containing protein
MKTMKTISLTHHLPITEPMANSLRPTGISVIGDVRWGTHFCYFYETKQDLLDTLVLYFKAGLENKEFCLWVVSPPLTVEEAKRAFGGGVADLDRHLAEGSLEIHGHDEWYLNNGRCDTKRVLLGWSEKLNKALARGYAGMRASGDTAWIQEDDWRIFYEYEKELDALIADQRRIILCTHPLATSPGNQIFDVARIHQVAVARRHGSWEMLETPELKQAKAEIKRLNDELEQKVEERTRELAASNEALKRQIIERQEAERQSRVLIDAIPHQIWSGPPDGTLDYCNERWRSYMGLEMEDLRGDGWQAMLHPDDRERVLKAWHESVVDGMPYEQEERHRGADGTYRWFLSRGVPLRDAEGRIARWHGTNTDIEDRKHAEQMLRDSRERLRALTARLESLREQERIRISREIHDELGQQLTGLKMDLRRAERKLEELESSPAVNSLLDTLVSATELADGITATIQEIAADLRPGVLDKLGLGAALQYEGRRFQERTGISCDARLPESEPVFSTEAATALFRIFQECLTNIARHARATKVEAALKLEDGWVTLRMQDNGRGITEAEIANPESLGLLGMKERTALLGGEIVFQRDPQGGTIVTARLPQSGTFVQTKGPV